MIFGDLNHEMSQLITTKQIQLGEVFLFGKKILGKIIHETSLIMNKMTGDVLNA